MGFPLFISYASDDQAVALHVCALLEGQGVPCWIAPRDVAPGAKWDEAIVDAITAAGAFLLILTAGANESPYVGNEVNHAFAAKKPIFTFRVEDVQPSKSLGFYLARHHWTDGFPAPIEGKLAQLAAAVTALLPAVGDVAGASVPTGRGGFSRFDDVTRDGRYLVFRSQYPLPGIWIQRVGVPGERRALVQGQFGATQGRVSPDGRWLAYTLGLPRGPEVFVQPFDRPGDRFQVSRTGGTGAIWRADSRELYYETTDGLMAVALTEQGSALDAGTPQKLFSLHTQGYIYVTSQPHNVEVAANGQKFLVNTIVGDSDNIPIEVTLNWTTGLKK